MSLIGNGNLKAQVIRTMAMVADADTSILVGENITNTVTGTMRVHWIFLGDD